jgi:outer membrane lipoprotein-sorting protein
MTTTREAEIEQKLAQSLGRLRHARPEFQAELEARLVARIPKVARPWWRRSFATARQVGRVIPRRRALLGMAAAAAGLLSLASVTLPLSQPPEVSAGEILEKAEAFAANPLMANVKSFHLTAKTTGKLGPDSNATATRTIEQWYVSPNRMRNETRTQTTDGKTVVSGFVHDGDSFRHYQTPGAKEADMFAVIAAPPIASAKVGEQKPGDVQPAAKAGMFIKKIERNEKDGAVEIEEKDVVFNVVDCRESRRGGEETVAGRKTYVVETDFSSCLPKDAPVELAGKHLTWVDKETYLPLKMEAYAKDGKLQHSYEVTQIAYDGAIADSVFTNIPPQGTELKDLPFPKGSPGLKLPPGAIPPPGDGHRVILIERKDEQR